MKEAVFIVGFKPAVVEAGQLSENFQVLTVPAENIGPVDPAGRHGRIAAGNHQTALLRSERSSMAPDPVDRVNGRETGWLHNQQHKKVVQQKMASVMVGTVYSITGFVPMAIDKKDIN